MQVLQDFPLSRRLPEMPMIAAAYAANHPDVIPLSFGYPAPEIFPVSQITEATKMALQSQGRDALQYTGGIGPKKIIEWIQQRSLLRSIHAETNQIMVTTGSMQGIDIATRTLTDPGDEVWIESPSFFGAIRSFRVAEVNLTSFPIDENGLRVDLVEKALLDAKLHNKPLPKMLYVIPNYHNPGGINLSLERRKKLAELAYEYNFFILEDDAYVELSFTNQYLPAIYSFCPERVIYLSTFSKVIAPGIRMGWAIAGEQVLNKMQMLKSDGATSVFVQEVIHHLLEIIDFKTHLSQLTSLYRTRRDMMVEAIKENFSDHVSFELPEGGFFLWLLFGQGVNTSMFSERALDYGVSFLDGQHFFLENQGFNHLRLCYTYCNEEQIRKGVTRIADSYFEYLNKQ